MIVEVKNRQQNDNIYTRPNIDLLGSVTCESDIIEIEHYVKTNWTEYTPLDLKLFLTSINMINKIFK